MEQNYIYRKEDFEMDEEIRDLLGKEIKTQIQDLSDLEPGSKEKLEAVEAIAKLYKLRIEEAKNELEFEDRRERRGMEEAKNEQEFEDRRERRDMEKSKNELEFEDRRERRDMEKSKNELEFEDRRERRDIERTKNEQDFRCRHHDGELKREQVNEEVANHVRQGQFNKEQLAEQVKDRYFKLGIAAAEIVLPLIFYATWMRKGFKFEETGTFTSTTFRGLFNRFRPTK